MKHTSKPQMVEFDPLANPQKILYLCLSHEQCCKQWVEDSQLHPDDMPEDIRLLANAIRESWKQDKVLLTRKAFEIWLISQKPTLENPKLLAQNFVYDSAKGLAGLTPADLPSLIRQAAADAEMQSRRERCIEMAEALKRIISDPTQTDIDKVRLNAAQIAANYLGDPVKIRSSATPDQTKVEPVILVDGLLRKGELAQMVSSPKMRKTFAVHELAYCLSNGGKWMGHFQCTPSKVLVVDNELHEWALQARIAEIRRAKGNAEAEGYDFLPLREDGLIDIYGLCNLLSNKKNYDIIILDALYRFFPEKFDENSNADWTRLSNTLQQLARDTGAAILFVHHSSKGDQQFKSTTDAGSGGGAQSRAADAIFNIKAKVQKGEAQGNAPEAATFSAVVRGFKPVKDLNILWEYPFWRAVAPEATETQKESRSIESFAASYARPEWESRAKIEGRARENQWSVRDAHAYFDGAIGEKLIDVKLEIDGKSRIKLYKLHTKANEDWS